MERNKELIEEVEKLKRCVENLVVISDTLATKLLKKVMRKKRRKS